MNVAEIIKNTDGILIVTDQGNYGFYGIREDIIRVVYTKKENVENQSLLIESEVYENSVNPEFAETETEVIVHTYSKIKSQVAERKRNLYLGGCPVRSGLCCRDIKAAYPNGCYPVYDPGREARCKKSEDGRW